MKKICIYFLAATFLSAGLLSSCKKYEEGPTFSLRSKKARLTGDWEFEKVTYTSGGATEDVTSDYAGGSFTIDKDGTGSVVIPGESAAPFTWEFSSDKEAMLITINGEQFTWKILKLKNKEVWFEENMDGDIFEIHLKQ